MTLKCLCVTICGRNFCCDDTGLPEISLGVDVVSAGPLMDPDNDGKLFFASSDGGGIEITTDLDESGCVKLCNLPANIDTSGNGEALQPEGSYYVATLQGPDGSQTYTFQLDAGTDYTPALNANGCVNLTMISVESAPQTDQGYLIACPCPVKPDPANPGQYLPLPTTDDGQPILPPPVTPDALVYVKADGTVTPNKADACFIGHTNHNGVLDGPLIPEAQQTRPVVELSSGDQGFGNLGAGNLGAQGTDSAGVGWVAAVIEGMAYDDVRVSDTFTLRSTNPSNCWDGNSEIDVAISAFIRASHPDDPDASVMVRVSLEAEIVPGLFLNLTAASDEINGASSGEAQTIKATFHVAPQNIVPVGGVWDSVLRVALVVPGVRNTGAGPVSGWTVLDANLGARWSGRTDTNPPIF